MTQFSIQIDKQQMAEVQKVLGSAAKADKVYRRAVSDTLKRANSTIAKQAKGSLELKLKDIRNRIRITKSAMGFSGVVNISGSQIKLIHYWLAKNTPAKADKWIHAKPPASRKPLALQVRKGKTESHRQAFLVRYKSGKLDIAQRDGNKRLPISSKYGASIRQGFEHNHQNLRVEDDLTTYLQQRVATQLQLILEGKRR